jgi:hypothetical protein
MKKKYHILAFAILLASCNPDKVDTKGVKEEMEKYKIKRITSGEILNTSVKLGDELSSKIQTSIDQKLDSAIKAGGIEAALPFCIAENNEVLKGISQEYSIIVKRAGFPAKLRNEQNKPDSLQTSLLEAYLFNTEKGFSLSGDALVREKEVIYNGPITIHSRTCLSCHGKIGSDIPEKEYHKLKSKYPNDKSLNFKLNDPIGVWTLILPKETVIRNVK